MLCPVAQHHYNTGKDKWDYENEKGGLKVYKRHTHAEKIKRYFSVRQTHIQFFPFPGKQIDESIPEAQQKKTAHIFQKIREAVSFIFHRAAGIIFLVILHMMHGHVMYKICFRGVAKKRTNKPDDIIIYPGISFFKRFAMAYAMQHQSEATFKIHLRNIEVRNVGQPPIPAL